MCFLLARRGELAEEGEVVPASPAGAEARRKTRLFHGALDRLAKDAELPGC